jgi:hypothetical protein
MSYLKWDHSITYVSDLRLGPCLGRRRRHHHHIQHAVLTTCNKNRILQLNRDLKKVNNFVGRTLNVLL